MPNCLTANYAVAMLLQSRGGFHKAILKERRTGGKAEECQITQELH